MRYFGLFKENGERITSLVENLHFSNEDEKSIAIKKIEEKLKEQGYTGELLGFELTEEEQNLYQTNEYIRSADGKPQKKPVAEPIPQEHEQIDSAILDLAEAVAAQEARLQKLEGSTKA